MFTATCTLTDNGILWQETFATEAEALNYVGIAWLDLAMDPETGDLDATMVALATNTPLDASASCEDGTYRMFIVDTGAEAACSCTNPDCQI